MLLDGRTDDVQIGLSGVQISSRRTATDRGRRIAGGWWRATTDEPDRAGKPVCARSRLKRRSRRRDTTASGRDDRSRGATRTADQVPEVKGAWSNATPIASCVVDGFEQASALVVSHSWRRLVFGGDDLENQGGDGDLLVRNRFDLLQHRANERTVRVHDDLDRSALKRCGLRGPSREGATQLRSRAPSIGRGPRAREPHGFLT